MGRGDLDALSGVQHPLGVPLATGANAALFRVAEDRLVSLSDLMHRNFHKCGGFFAHGSRAEAEADLGPWPQVAGGPYSVDQQAVVKPIVARVEEKELRATIETLAAYNNRYYTADSGVAAAQWIAGRWQQAASGLTGATVRQVPHSGWKQPSVVLTIPGSELPQEVVVLGGHLDSISGFWGGAAARAPGADDNASGIAVLTEALRVLGKAGWRPKRTVEFMGYAAEEVGLRGSKEIAAQYKGSGRKVAGVIQFDMTNFKGAGDTVYLLTDNVDSSLTQFLGRLVDEYAGVSWGSTSCGYACSDHASWTRSGFPASAAFESSFDTMNKNIHTENDTLGNSGGSAEHSVKFAKLAAAFAVELGKTAGNSKTAGQGTGGRAGR